MGRGFGNDLTGDRYRNLHWCHGPCNTLTFCSDAVVNRGEQRHVEMRPGIAVVSSIFDRVPAISEDIDLFGINQLGFDRKSRKRCNQSVDRVKRRCFAQRLNFPTDSPCFSLCHLWDHGDVPIVWNRR